MATSDVPTVVTRLNDVRNCCAGTGGGCGKSGGKCEPPDKQEDDRDDKEEREKCSINASSENVTRAMLSQVV